MKLLGIDPGPASCGWMTIEAHGLAKPVFLACGDVPSRGVEIALLLHTKKPDVIAIEKPVWQNHGHDPVATRAVASNLIDTNYVVGRIAGLAVAGGVRLIELPAQTWRLGLLRNRSPSDAEIKAALQGLLVGLPARTNVHERDAGGVAIAAARVIGNGAEAKYASGF